MCILLPPLFVYAGIVDIMNWNYEGRKEGRAASVGSAKAGDGKSKS
jgi:hypothetical protein